jgi:glycosyltransferase involved in cell wall biosynthesis
MPPLKCGSLALRGIQPHQPASGEMFGAHLAELRLVEAVLDRSDTLQWDLWDSEVPPSVTHTSGHPLRNPEVAELKKRFGERVRARSIDEITEAALDPGYLFVSNVPSLSRIGELRTRIGAHAMPICALSHSLYTKELLFGYSWLLISVEPHDNIVISSEAGKQALEHLFAASRERLAERLGVPEARLKSPRITKIPFGVALPKQDELTREQSRVLLKIPPRAFVVLYFGRISEEYKGDLDPFLQAVYHARALGHDVWILLAGQSLDSAYSQHLERRMHALRLSETSIVLENCPDFLRPSLYVACDVMVSPADSVQETFGLSILEAMAHARPVIASDWSGYRDLVQDGKTGFLIQTTWVTEIAEQAALRAILAPPLSAAHYLSQRTILDAGALVQKLLTLLENTDLRTSMGKAGRARVEALYTWPCVADKFLALWNEQLSISARAPQRPPPPVFECFSHYASTRLHPDHLLVRVAGTEDEDPDVLLQWKFHDHPTLEQVRRLLKLTAQSPVSVGELLHEGFDLHSILWLAKKGLRRIVQA